MFVESGEEVFGVFVRGFASLTPGLLRQAFDFLRRQEVWPLSRPRERGAMLVSLLGRMQLRRHYHDHSGGPLAARLRVRLSTRAP